MTKRILFISLSIIISLTVLYGFDQNQNNKLRMAEAAIAEFYVEQVDENKLVETAIKAMLESLDPHSQ